MVLKRELFVLCLVSAACGSNDEAGVPSADAGVDRFSAAPGLQLVESGVADAGNDAAPIDAACNVAAQTHEIQTAAHVQEGSPITYSTNPPSSGPHYPIWANFKEYDHPIADGYLVHSMEHGAVLVFYDCDPAQCTPPAGVAEGLRAVLEAVATDPLCDPAIRARVILAPRPANETAVSAAAWGATYRADCVDAPSLLQFISGNYAKGPENFCSPGANL